MAAAIPIWLAVGSLPSKFRCNFNKQHNLQPTPLHISSICESSLNFKSSLNCNFKDNQITDEHTEGFSVLSSDIPWEKESIWGTMAMYMFNLHIPLGIGGLSIVAHILHRPVLEPQAQALSLLVIQILELSGALLLLRSTAKREYELGSFFQANKLTKERNCLLASLLGFGILTFLVFLTSLLAESLVGPKAVNNPVVKEILLSSNISKAACVLVYCVVAPLLEETVYRGFLLTSLASTKKWQLAVFLSSVVFSAAHFSPEYFIQLFIIGCVLGCCYCWTGNLSSSILVHSLYNAMTLVITFLS